jgi:hypothetical protein
MRLICLHCEKGKIEWLDPEVKDLEGDMICDHCGFIYHGMSDYIETDDLEHGGGALG